MKLLNAITSWWNSNVSVPRKRVLLAKDIIGQLNAKRFVATRGRLFRGGLARTLAENECESAQSIIKENECLVCAKGAALIAYVKRFNNISCGQLNSANNGAFEEVYKLDIVKVFPATMLAEMETLYERKDSYKFEFNAPYLSHDESRRLVRASYDLFPDDDDERLKVIFGMLIANKGKRIYLDIAHTNEKRFNTNED